MPTNPLFLHGTSDEQNLIQDLVNEQIRMFGSDVFYLPRKIINKDTILGEVESSSFDNRFIIEMFIASDEGYGGAGDVMTKFGLNIKDDITFVVSRERFELFISPMLLSIYGSNASLRPREGDLIYLPLVRRLFEIKFVEHEKPFYQLKKNYVYELQCELYEYQDEEIDTSDQNIDDIVKDVPYVEMILMNTDAIGATGQAEAVFIENNPGFVRQIVLNNDGNGYDTTPIVSIEPSPVGLATANATAVAVTRKVGDAKSVEEILITNTGYGYTTVPTVTISGGGGVGAAAAAVVQQSDNWIKQISITNIGSGYRTQPAAPFITDPDVSGNTKPSLVAITTATRGGSIFEIRMRDAGSGGYTNQPIMTINEPFSLVGLGTAEYKLSEVVTGEVSGATAFVASWDINNMQLRVYSSTGDFLQGENIVGSETGAKYNINLIAKHAASEPYSKNDEIEQAADLLIDFSEDNPFGTY